MFVDFEKLPENSRLWIYQAPNSISTKEQIRISDFLKNAIEGWKTHGSPMKGSFKFEFDRILIIAADIDFQEPSGCSLDEVSRWLKQINQEFGVDFFDRSISYFENGSLFSFPLFQAKKVVAESIVSPETKILNLQVPTKGLLKSEFVVEAQKSFLKRYFLLEQAGQNS